MKKIIVMNLLAVTLWSTPGFSSGDDYDIKQCPDSAMDIATKYALKIPLEPDGPNSEPFFVQCFQFKNGFYTSVKRTFGIPGERYSCDVSALMDLSQKIHNQWKLWDHPSGNPYGVKETSRRWSCRIICDYENDFCGQGSVLGD